jgi:hypothetical protein
LPLCVTQGIGYGKKRRIIGRNSSPFAGIMTKLTPVDKEGRHWSKLRHS